MHAIVRGWKEEFDRADRARLGRRQWMTVRDFLTEQDFPKAATAESVFVHRARQDRCHLCKLVSLDDNNRGRQELAKVLAKQKHSRRRGLP